MDSLQQLAELCVEVANGPGRKDFAVFLRLLVRMGEIAKKHLPYEEAKLCDGLMVRSSPDFLDHLDVTIRLIDEGEFARVRNRLRRFVQIHHLWVRDIKTDQPISSSVYQDFREFLLGGGQEDWAKIKRLLCELRAHLEPLLELNS